MAAFVPLCGRGISKLGGRGISKKSDTGEWMECCISVTLAKRRPFGDITGAKRKRSTRRRAPELMEELIAEILARLPVKSLLCCKSVCKAWRAIISYPIFIQAHLRHSAARWEQDPSFIISPHTLNFIIEEEEWPTTFSNHFHFYQWRWQQGTASHQQAAADVYDQDLGDEFRRVHYFSHCDGLVFAPTDTTLHVFNPATRDITLPESRRNVLWRGGRACCYCVGLGCDPRTGKYKVVQAFYRSKDCTRMGMEVFTIASDDAVAGGDDWREIANDPPYPVSRFQTGMSINGFMFWQLGKPEPHLEQPPRALLHLSLEDEEFGVTGLPVSFYDPDLDDAILMLDVLHGRELCLAACTSDTTFTIWTLPVAEEGPYSVWECRYTIQGSGFFRAMVLPPLSSGIILSHLNNIYRYNLATSELTKLCEMDRMRYQGRRARKWKNLYFFNVKPYTESLVPITK